MTAADVATLLMTLRSRPVQTAYLPTARWPDVRLQLDLAGTGYAAVLTRPTRGAQPDVLLIADQLPPGVRGEVKPAHIAGGMTVGLGVEVLGVSEGWVRDVAAARAATLSVKGLLP